jgi:hypothetical protein
VLIPQGIDIVQNIVGKPFSVLTTRIQAIFSCFGSIPLAKWDFAVDPETGLNILQVEKDPFAIEKIRTMADSLLK